jgi:hypothetical protein
MTIAPGTTYGLMDYGLHPEDSIRWRAITGR